MRVASVAAAAVLLAITMAGRGWIGPGHGGPTEPGVGVVAHIVDGDTVVVRIGGAAEHVRLIGIDAPESADARSPVECFGAEASEQLAGLIPPGTEVRLVRDAEARDRYERLLAYLFRTSDDMHINLAMVEEGFAAAYTVPPNLAHTGDFFAAVARAREQGRGLWGACGGHDVPMAPERGGAGSASR